MTKLFPRQGDIIYIDVEPHSGHEYGGHSPQTGNVRRPMIVLSSDEYNAHTGMLVGMVVTSTNRHLDPALHQQFMDLTSGVHGQIVMWQIPNYDYVSRHAEIKGHVSDKLLQDLRQRAKDIFD